MKISRSLATLRMTLILGGAALTTISSSGQAAGQPGAVRQVSGAYHSEYCPECHGYSGATQTVYGGYDAGYGHRCRRGLFGGLRGGYGQTIARPPVLPIVQRYPKVYNRYWADHIVRNSGPAVRTAPAPSYPMVHTPTDTTQLGYGYVHVPYFHFRPEMLPPAPVPTWGTGPWSSVSYSGIGDEEYYPQAPVNNVQPTPVRQGPAPEPIPVEGKQARGTQVPAPQTHDANAYFTGARS